MGGTVEKEESDMKVRWFGVIRRPVSRYSLGDAREIDVIASEVSVHGVIAVSYTHLTLPTILLV